jgi:hypothetical protein
MSLSASRFILPEDMKQTLTLISIANIFSHNSNPFIYGMLMLGQAEEGRNSMYFDSFIDTVIAIFYRHIESCGNIFIVIYNQILFQN